MPRPIYRHLTRRELLALAGQAGLVGALRPDLAAAGIAAGSTPASGAVVGNPIAAKVGESFLQQGGNAIDAAIAAAFAAGIATPSMCGIGGYGGHAIIALAGGRKITAIDFNSVAPAAAWPDMYPLEPDGRVKGAANATGWRAAGVPGTVAGLELALGRYGTRSLRDILAPVIEMCESGQYVTKVKGMDPEPEASGPSTGSGAGGLPSEARRNLALAKLLKRLAARNAAESFYRGDIADTIAAAFRKNGGLVTRADLAAYRAREVEPLALEWNGAVVHTVPLAATGLLLLEAFSILKAIRWTNLPAPERMQAKVEALRIAWADRLRYFGDPDQVTVPVAKLASPAHAGEWAEKVSRALQSRQPVTLEITPSQAGGTTNISAVDARGNMIAITLTHGDGYGARVFVEELGLVLGHGMSRFDPRPGRPNSPGPGKRPITNMCPSIVTRGGVAVLAIGAAGGTRIPSGVYEVLLQHVGRGEPLDAAMASPRLHTTGGLTLGMQKAHSPADEAFFRGIGYQTSLIPSALVSAVSFDAATGLARGLSNGGA